MRLFPAPSAQAVVAAPPFRSRIELEDVTVQPEGAPAPALRKVSFIIEQGEMLGIAGATGAGKSTLLAVLAGLRAPDAGTIRVDGVPEQLTISGHRRRAGYVPQAPFIADDTLLRNVAFGLPDEEVDEECALAALEGARLHAFVATLPDGPSSRAGENGALLSGGERQRLALARALYADPEILLLDEATSALDPATEREIVGTLRGLVPEKTVVLVSHRPEALRAVDRVLLLERGRLVGSGRFEDLLATNEAFRALVGNSARARD
jgi:ATP-binding cassette subfamily C protein